MKTIIINDRDSVMKDLHGSLWNEYRRLWREAGSGKKVTDFPLHLDFDTADACNYKCAVCNEGDRKRTKCVMTTALFKQVMDECSRLGVFSINIGNIGEPFLYPDNLIEFIKIARNSGIIDVFVHTNGALVTSDVAERLVGSGISVICFSIDASTKETYEKIRGGDYDAVIKNINRLIEIKKVRGSKLPFVRVSMVPCELNRDEIDTFIEYWKTRADVIDIQSYVDVGFGKNILKDKKKNCLMPFQRMMIWPDGRIGACCLGKSLGTDLLIGKFPEISIVQAWNNEKIENLRRSMIEFNLKEFPSCEQCIAATYV